MGIGGLLIDGSRGKVNFEPKHDGGSDGNSIVEQLQSFLPRGPFVPIREFDDWSIAGFFFVNDTNIDE